MMEEDKDLVIMLTVQFDIADLMVSTQIFLIFIFCYLLISQLPKNKRPNNFANPPGSKCVCDV